MNWGNVLKNINVELNPVSRARFCGTKLCFTLVPIFCWLHACTVVFINYFLWIYTMALRNLWDWNIFCHRSFWLPFIEGEDKSYTQVYHENGLLNSRTIMAHGTYSYVQHFCGLANSSLPGCAGRRKVLLRDWSSNILWDNTEGDACWCIHECSYVHRKALDFRWFNLAERRAPIQITRSPVTRDSG